MEPEDSPPIDTLEMKQQLVSEGWTDTQADSLIAMLRNWSRHMATKDFVRSEMRYQTIRIILAVIAVNGMFLGVAALFL